MDGQRCIGYAYNIQNFYKNVCITCKYKRKLCDKLVFCLIVTKQITERRAQCVLNSEKHKWLCFFFFKWDQNQTTVLLIHYKVTLNESSNFMAMMWTYENTKSDVY